LHRAGPGCPRQLYFSRYTPVDPVALDEARLVETIASAVGLRDDARTARLAAELLRRRHRAVPRLDLTSVVSPLVRQAIAREDPDAALSWIERAKSMGNDMTAKTLEIWRGEILARAGRPELALSVYLKLIEPDAKAAELALDAAETMLDNGHLDEANTLLNMACDPARRQNRPRHWINRRASDLLNQLSWTLTIRQNERAVWPRCAKRRRILFSPCHRMIRVWFGLLAL
jgi:hypothetical protein